MHDVLLQAAQGAMHMVTAHTLLLRTSPHLATNKASIVRIFAGGNGPSIWVGPQRLEGPRPDPDLPVEVCVSWNKVPMQTPQSLRHVATVPAQSMAMEEYNSLPAQGTLMNSWQGEGVS